MIQIIVLIYSLDLNLYDGSKADYSLSYTVQCLQFSSLDSHFQLCVL